MISLSPVETNSIRIRYTPNIIAKHSTELSIVHNANNLPTPLVLPVTGEALRADAIVQLDQSKPNPTIGSSGTATIPFAISEDSDVRIDLYSVDGRLVRKIGRASCRESVEE